MRFGRASVRRMIYGFHIRRIVCLPAILLMALQSAGCSRAPTNQPLTKEDMPLRDINLVLRDHDDELLSIPGVVGVYVGVLEDGKTPCLKVMVIKKTPELEQKIPKSLEGYPVLLDETGVIRPLSEKK